ncbi:WD40 repeat domain-containing protein [Endozoicomonas sp. ISHI1]|uniref:WD40 repeat domain-containing protein n=1 Tax=Endozoicomonas sp. ISHI1 TaxID=2825882 RepID=UPI002148CDA8|nr:hypothetical protein [Endozoicomonas sp. ISHI1]
MDSISNHSCFDDPLSSTPDQSHSETPPAITMGREVIVLDKNKLSLLLDLPLGIQSKIFTYLRAHDITQLTRANSYINNTLKNDDSMARAWYRRFAPSHQALIKTVVTAKDIDELQKWLKRFTKDEALVKSVMDRQSSIHFPTLFFFTITKLMIECKTFTSETKASLPNNGKINSAAFSADGQYLVSVSDSKTVIIFGQESDGSWKEKAIISHLRDIRSTTFSINGGYVITASFDGTAKIYGQNSDGSWEEKATISHPGDIRSARLSIDGHVLTTHRVARITELSMNE